MSSPRPGAKPARPDGQPSVQTVPAERHAPSVNGLLGLIVLLGLYAVSVYFFVQGAIEIDDGGSAATLIWATVLFVVCLILNTAFTVISPGDTKVVQFFGAYVGTIRRTGIRMTYPLTNRHRVSVKVRNFETRELKVNDATGNPVNIAAIVVWQVEDTARATFAVEKYKEFVATQSEAALRHIATIHPYDNGRDGEPTLRGSTDLVAEQLAVEVAERVAIAGLRVIETRISTLAFAPEIAQAMLQRQQADALLSARSRIVEGAVTMVESALARLEADGVVDLDEERKAVMVSNLLVVLCSDSRATPVVNTGTLYA
jgi:regulator of protease activity HflC (stomatin/prohibitin superfamily)